MKAAAALTASLHLQLCKLLLAPKVVITHGTKRSSFWKNAQAAARQSASDMGVQLEMELYETFDAIQMAADIEKAAFGEKPVDALVVTVPSEDVHDAIQKVIQEGIPVFGFNSGYKVVNKLGLLGFIAQDEYIGGIAAAEEFIRISKTTKKIQKALFINHESWNSALNDRFQGFNETMYKKRFSPVDQLNVDFADESLLIKKINDAFNDGCKYDTVLLAGGGTAPYAVSALVQNGCEGKVNVGTFDQNQFIIESIIQGKIAFAASQQLYIQSVLPVIMASLYSTTGKRLALPLDTKIYSTGPKIINQQTIPSDTLIKCEKDAFPICPNNLAPDGSVSACDCFDRTEIRIGGVLHGITTDIFWDPVFAAAEQAAIDMGVELDLERFVPEEDSKVLHKKMASRIRTLCESGVDGIFVTIPSNTVVGAIKDCQLLNVPVVAVNAGVEIAKQLGLMHYIGQTEYEAGYAAGKHLIEEGMQIGYCFNHSPGLSTIVERCRGFNDAIIAHGVIYGGEVNVGFDSSATYVIKAEEAIGAKGDWDGVGILLGGGDQMSMGAAKLKEMHRGCIMGTFDIVPYSIELVKSGDLKFAIDQQPLLQGNLPVYLLSYFAYTNQALLDDVVQTGPAFIKTAPSEAQKLCEDNFYDICPILPEENLNFISKPVVVMSYVAVALTIFTGLASLGWTYLYRKKNIVRASQPPFLVMISVGCILSVLCIIPMKFQTDYRYLKDFSTGQTTTTVNPNIAWVDSGCMTMSWLYGLGFVFTFSALFAKIYRVKLIYMAGQTMRRKKVGIIDVLPYLATMIIIELALLIAWQVLSPHRWERKVLITDVDGYALESFGHCTSKKGWDFFLAILMFHIFSLLYALVLCFQTKHIPTEFAESNWVSLAVICIFQISVLAIPIATMVRENNTTVFFFVRACAVFLQNFTVLCLIFGPKVYRVITGDDELPVSSVASRGASTVSRATSVSRFSSPMSNVSRFSSIGPSSNYYPTPSTKEDCSTTLTVQDSGSPAATSVGREQKRVSFILDGFASSEENDQNSVILKSEEIKLRSNSKGSSCLSLSDAIGMASNSNMDFHPDCSTKIFMESTDEGKSFYCSHCSGEIFSLPRPEMAKTTTNPIYQDEA